MSGEEQLSDLLHRFSESAENYDESIIEMLDQCLELELHVAYIERSPNLLAYEAAITFSSH